MRDYDIESDLKQEKFQSLKLVQGDRGNKIKINVYEDGQPVSLTGCSISAKYKRADGEVVNDGTIENITDNYFYAVIDSNITKVSGTLKMLFSIEKDDVKVSTFLLLADVREGIGESTGGGEVTVDLSNYYKKNETYSKSQIDSQFKDIANEDLTIGKDGKLHIKQGDGTLKGSGVKLPTISGNVTTISNDIDLTEFAYDVIKFKNNILDGEVADNANASAYLKIPVYNNATDFQATHPSVLYFKNGWNGYKYWMAMTPYESENESLENPSIVASNDGINWEVPNGLENPLISTSDVTNYHYSDTHLVFAEGYLECWYRKRTRNTLGDSESIIRKKSNDGINWGDEEVLHTDSTGANYLCPCVSYIKGIYKIWVCTYTGIIKYYESINGDNWIYIRDITLEKLGNNKIWHFDIKQTANGYEIYYCAGTSAICYEMQYCISSDNISYSKPIVVMNGASEKFDYRIYRPCFLDIGFDRWIYYGAVSSDNKWYIGISKCKIYSPKILNGYTETDKVRVTGVTVQSSIQIQKGNKLDLIVNILPKNASMKLYKLESSNPTIVSCYEKTISAINTGQSEITVTTLDGNFTATCNVEVIENTSEVNSINLLDYSKLKEGCYYDANTGDLKTSASNKCFEFIPISPNKEIEFYGVSGAFFNSGKTFISGIPFSSESVKKVTTPSNASYICINISSNDSLGKTYLVELPIPESTIEVGVNLFDSSKATLSGYYDSGKNGQFVNSTEYGTSDFIKVNPGIKISHNGTLMTGWNKNREFYGSIEKNSIIPNSVDFITVSFKLSEINNINIKRSE